MNYPDPRDALPSYGLGWVAGTGFMVGPRVVMTNRHVVTQFAERVDGEGGPRWAFKENPPEAFDIGPAEVWINFGGTFDGRPAPRLRVAEVLLAIPEDQGPDVALLRVLAPDGVGPRPRPRSRCGRPRRTARKSGGRSWSAAIRPTLASTIWGRSRGASGAYKAKRISPGEVTHLLDDRPYRGPTRPTIYHDCSTLHGSSGSPLIDLASGEVWAIHYYGRDGVANYAEPMWAVMRDEQVGRHLEVGAAAAPDRPGPPGAIVPRGTEIVQRMDLRPTNDDFLKGYLTGQGPEGVPGFMGMNSRSYGELEESIPSVGFLSSDGITRTTCFLVAPDLVLTTFDIGMLREDMEEGPLWVDFNRTVQRVPDFNDSLPRVPSSASRRSSPGHDGVLS